LNLIEAYNHCKKNPGVVVRLTKTWNYKEGKLERVNRAGVKWEKDQWYTVYFPKNKKPEFKKTEMLLSFEDINSDWEVVECK